MLLFTLIVALSLALVPLSTATPLVTTLSAPSSNASSSGTSSSSTPPDGPQAKRRGVAYNRPEYVHLFDVQESGVQWCYNWDSLTNPTNTPFEYVAMLWSNGDDVTSKWDESVRRSALAQPNDPTHLLGFNEPDNCQQGAGGACMPLADAVGAWLRYMEPAKNLKEKMYLGSPAVTNGGGNQGLAYLRAFLDQCKGCNIDFICVHWYDSADNFAYFKQHMEEVKKIANGRPIWLTEFAAFGSTDKIKSFLDQAIPYMDKDNQIARYAYFMAHPGLLLNGNGGGLSEIGQHYVNWKAK